MTHLCIRWAPYVYLVACLWATMQQIPVWRSNLTLWRHAAELAPLKPRVALNYGLALLASGDTTGAIAQWRRAAILSQAPHIPEWDRRETNDVVLANLKTLQGLRRR